MRIIEHLRRHIDNLGPDVHAITVSQDGELVTVSSNPYNDETTCPPVPALQDLQNPRVKTVRRAELRELDRIAPNVDLVSFRRRRAIFKYSFIEQHLKPRWNELNILLRLQLHPNVVPLDQVVVEELCGQEHVVGFTTRYIGGGSLDATDNAGDRRVFKLKWLRQLMRVVDDLNYKYGIQHQDVAPRNLLVHEATDQIMLIDFGVSARIGAVDDPHDDQYRGDGYDENLNDLEGVIFTLYEIITRDDQFRLIQNRWQQAPRVLNMEDWVKHPDVRLDKPVARYRDVLDAWVSRRKARGGLEVFTDAPNYINWPDIPKAQPKAEDKMAEDAAGNSEQRGGLGEDDMNASHGGEADQVHQRSSEAAPLIPDIYPRKQIERQAARAKGIQVITWQRPGQEKIREGMHVFADGTVIMSNKTH